MTPRRVLFIDLAPTPAGSIVSLRYLVRGLDSDRYQPLVLLSQVNPAARQFREANIPVWTIPSHQGHGVSFGPGLDAVRRGRIGAWVRSHRRLARVWHAGGALGTWYRRIYPEAQRIRRVIRDAQPDLVHLNAELVINRAGALAAYQEGIPTVCHVRGWERWNIWDRLLALTVRAFVCISQAVARRLVAQGAIDARVHVVYNGLDVQDVPTQPRPELYEILGIHPGRPTIGIFSRLVPWKGHTVFIEAAALVARELPEVQVLVVGAEEITAPGYVQALKEQANRLGIGENVRFLGHRDDVLDLYPLVDVLVHASIRDEPFGRVIIEGMAAARPVVATRGGGTVEIVREGETGYLVPQGDARAMAAAILDLLQNPEKARQMGEAGRRDVATRFRADEAARRIMHIYDMILT